MRVGGDEKALFAMPPHLLAEGDRPAVVAFFWDEVASGGVGDKWLAEFVHILNIFVVLCLIAHGVVGDVRDVFEEVLYSAYKSWISRAGGKLKGFELVRVHGCGRVWDYVRDPIASGKVMPGC